MPKQKNIRDYRTKKIFKGNVDFNPFIPKGVINEILELQALSPKGSPRCIGDVEIGDDGFIEIMFILPANIRKDKSNLTVVKLKRLPNEKEAFIAFY